MKTTRRAAVAGRFYPADPGVLDRDVRRFLESNPPAAEAEGRAFGVIAPHAGYVYSGAIAGSTYARVRVPDRVLVLGPNHTGLGVPRSVTAADEWEVPGGPVSVDAALRAALVRDAGLEPDSAAHLREHAAEVQLPFLRVKNPSVRFVAVCLGGLSFAECRRMGEAMAKAVRTEGNPDDVLFVASSDMSHYVPADVAKELDGIALDRVLALDPEGLHRVVRERHISMCGYIPATIALVAALELGATRATLVRYGNSGDISGDTHRVVGYAGVVLS